MIRNFLLIFLITVPSCLYTSDKKKDRPLTIQEIDASWRLFVTIKYARFDDPNLAKQVSELLKKGALPSVFYEKHDERPISALTLAQQKNMSTIVAMLKGEDPLQSVWDEVQKRGYIKPEKGNQQPNRGNQTVVAKGFLAERARSQVNDFNDKKRLKAKL